MVLKIESEQIIANLLDNSISFCKEGENIFVNISIL